MFHLSIVGNFLIINKHLDKCTLKQHWSLNVILNGFLHIEQQALEKHHWLQLEEALEKQVQREASRRNTSSQTQGIAT